MNKEYLIYKLSDEVKNSCKIDKEAFTKFNVKRGLRNEDGSGVLVGLTNIGNVVGYERDEQGKLKPTEGKLYYRGYELDDLVTPLLKEKRFGFEEVASSCSPVSCLTRRNWRLLGNSSMIICRSITVRLPISLSWRVAIS